MRTSTSRKLCSRPSPLEEGARGGTRGSPTLYDDVQDVYANFDIPEAVLEAVAS